MPTIHLRLLLAATLVLVIFLGLGGLALDRAYRESLEQADRERLMGHIYSLLGAAEENRQGRMRLPDTPPNPRFSNPDSGLYAWVEGESGTYRWRSPSLLGRSPEPLRMNQPGGHSYWRQTIDGEAHLNLSYGVSWEDDSGKDLNYTFAVSEDLRGTKIQIMAFRDALIFWLGGAALVLLLVQWAVLGWGLRPLRQVAADLRRIESGETEQLEGRYPKELRGLTRSINSLIASGRAGRDRYRHSLGDLAHSLKTPLAVLRGALESRDAGQLQGSVDEQVSRMDAIVQYQLKRAAASGREEFVRPIAIAPVIHRIIDSLQKVYRDKTVSSSLELDKSTLFHGSEGDLLEILGNLLENAFKYCRREIHVRLISVSEKSARQEAIIEIEDDGMGIPASEHEVVLRRGQRADEKTPGQGIGLAVANEIIRLYGGKLEIEEGVAGGALLRIRFS